MDTLTTLTPSGGQHLFYLAPTGIEVRNTTGSYGARGLGPHLDVRATGGYVVAPGSLLRDDHGTTLHYRRHLGRPSRPQALPGWILHALTWTPPRRLPSPELDIRYRDSYIQAAVHGETTAIRDAGPGGRAHTVFKAAASLGELVGAGMLTEHDAYRALTAAAATHNGVHGWTPREADRHITNGLLAGQANPRRR